MGLENFTSGGGSDDDDEQDSSDSTGSNNSTSTTESTSTSTQDTLENTEMEFYGTGNADPGTRPMERKGAMSDYGIADLQQSKQGDIEIEQDSIKFHLPMFAMITPNPEFTQGERYQLKHQKEPPRGSWHNKVVACTSSMSTRLGKMNKEMVMLAAGTTSKKRAMEFINSKFDEDVSGDTNVYISYMLDCLFGRDLAQADEEFRAGELVDRDQIAKKVIQPKMLRLALERDNEE